MGHELRCDQGNEHGEDDEGHKDVIQSDQYLSLGSPDHNKVVQQSLAE